MVELNILVVAGKIRTSVVFAARPWITLLAMFCTSAIQIEIVGSWMFVLVPGM
jgi:hypothetical protein